MHHKNNGFLGGEVKWAKIKKIPTVRLYPYIINNVKWKGNRNGAENSPVSLVEWWKFAGDVKRNLEDLLTLSTRAGCSTVYEQGNEDGDHTSARCLPGQG